MSYKYSKQDFLKAFNCTKNNRLHIMSGELCGCISCINTFNKHQISYWIFGELGDTAICPYCYEESVIGEKSGLPITAEFLTHMNEYWYKGIRGLCLDWRIY